MVDKVATSEAAPAESPPEEIGHARQPQCSGDEQGEGGREGDEGGRSGGLARHERGDRRHAQRADES